MVDQAALWLTGSLIRFGFTNYSIGCPSGSVVPDACKTALPGWDGPFAVFTSSSSMEKSGLARDLDQESFASVLMDSDEDQEVSCGGDCRSTAAVPEPIAGTIEVLFFGWSSP